MINCAENISAEIWASDIKEYIYQNPSGYKGLSGQLSGDRATLSLAATMRSGKSLSISSKPTNAPVTAFTMAGDLYLAPAFM